ncbi:sialic acid-binding Ig-like lectin 14 [Embiotoca jacksoni]|uniref:sialic acid-binding Ig-like lectin 14 n=1 Tax=Embiotoca jacksoni TaxID=100190 RepID=UPI003703AF5D
MATSLTFLLVCCLLQGVLCDEFRVTLPQTIEVISGSCVTIPCCFNIQNIHEINLNKSCEAKWKSEDGSDFPSNFENLSTTKEVTGDLTKKDCTTTFTNMRPDYSKGYNFRLECPNDLKWTFRETIVTISVKDNPPFPTLQPSTLTVMEGTSVSLTCSAPAPCWHHPPTLTWTSNLGRNSPKDTTVSVSPSGPVPENTNVSLTCSSNANPAVRSYTWYTADRHQETYIGNGHVLNIEASKVNSPFFCKAENDVGVGCSNLSQIDVQFPPQILPSSDCTNTAGQVNCYCEAMGNPAPTIDWYLDGLPVNQSGMFAISNETLNDACLRSNITVTQPQGRDLSTLLCRSINSLGSASQKFCVTSLQSSAESQDRVMFLVIISTLVALLVLLCVLLFVIRAPRNCHNLKSQITGEINTSQLLIREENEVPSTTQDDANGTNSAINTANLPSTGQHDAEAPSDSSKKNGASCDVIYSSVTWKSKRKSKKEDESVDMNPSGSSYLEEAECRVGRNRRSFVSDALEMGNLYEELEPRIMRKEVECEYGQVKFKDKSTRQK